MKGKLGRGLFQINYNKKFIMLLFILYCFFRVSEEKSRLLNKLKEENNKLKEEKKQLLDSLSLEAEKNRRNSRKSSFQPNENNLNNLEEIQNELEVSFSYELYLYLLIIEKEFDGKGLQ